MRHKKIKYKIGNSSSHRKSLLRNLTCEVIKHGKIKTTKTKCQATRAYLEKLVTLAKVDSLANRRLAYSKLQNRPAVLRLFKEWGPKFKERKGGYTRMIKIADLRVGDAAEMRFLSFVD